MTGQTVGVQDGGGDSSLVFNIRLSFVVTLPKVQLYFL